MAPDPNDRNLHNLFWGRINTKKWKNGTRFHESTEWKMDQFVCGGKTVMMLCYLQNMFAVNNAKIDRNFVQ